MYPAKAPFPVYCHDCWFSDNWDPMRYGRDYDFSKNFFAQFDELQQVVPRIALQVENMANSDYSNQALECKNCYLVISALGNEDSMFSYRLLYSRNVLDSFAITKCEIVYQGLMGRESSNIFFSRGFADSHELYFCEEPRGSQYCFMSANLRRGSYVFRGERLTKEEYKKRFKDVDFGSHEATGKLKEEFAAMAEKAIHPHGTFKNVVNTTGNAIVNAKNCRYCFHGSNIENCHYCFLVDDAKDCMDMNNGGHGMELVYEMNTVGAAAFNSKFCSDAWPDVINLTYCDSCRSRARNLFGCISLRAKEYCILNKQYTKEEYEALIPKIIEQMNSMPYVDKKGRIYKYGEFFPAELSPFPYNDSMAQDFFKLTADEVRTQGFRWVETPKSVNATIMPEALPDNIKDIENRITKEIVGCAHAGKCNDRCTVGFRVTPREMVFYKKYNLPLPRLCPNCRHFERLGRINPLNLWRRKCQCAGKTSESGDYGNLAMHFHNEEHCPNEFETSYAPGRSEIVYCESCYNSEVA